MHATQKEVSEAYAEAFNVDCKIEVKDHSPHISFAENVGVFPGSHALRAELENENVQLQILFDELKDQKNTTLLVETMKDMSNG